MEDGQFQVLFGIGKVFPHSDHRRDPGCPGSLEDLRPVPVKNGVAQVGVSVRQRCHEASISEFMRGMEGERHRKEAGGIPAIRIIGQILCVDVFEPAGIKSQVRHKP
jgi:hypothetical protein